MRQAGHHIEFEGYFAEGFPGIFEKIRCFESPRGVRHECA